MGTAAYKNGHIGGANRDRTDDLLHAMQALSQLSYSPVSGKTRMLVEVGVFVQPRQQGKHAC